MVNVVETKDIPTAQKEEEPKKTTTDDNSSSDDEEVPGLEEGEVTEQQKKVAEAAGLSEQVTDKGAKQSRSEKKARKLFSKLGLKPVNSTLLIHKRHLLYEFFRCMGYHVCAFASRRVFSS